MKKSNLYEEANEIQKELYELGEIWVSKNPTYKMVNGRIVKR